MEVHKDFQSIMHIFVKVIYVHMYIQGFNTLFLEQIMSRSQTNVQMHKKLSYFCCCFFFKN